MERTTAMLHASAVLAGNRAVLIRGPAGSGKSRLVLALLGAADAGRLRFCRLVADDRVEITACHGRLVLRTPSTLAGLIEVRGLGIRSVPYEPMAIAGLVIDLSAPDAERMPAPAAERAEIAGVVLPRLPVAAGTDALAAVIAALHLPS